MRIRLPAAALPGLAVAIAGLFLAGGCLPDSIMSPIEVTLEPYLNISTFEFGAGARMVGKDGDRQPVSFGVGEIDKFHFEWGFRQKLRVYRHHVTNPPMDGSSIEYALDTVLSKEAVPDWTFRSFPLDTSSFRLDGDSLRIRGYESAIFIASDRDRTALGAKGGWFLDLRVRPAARGLVGDSVRVLHPDSTGSLVPE